MNDTPDGTIADVLDWVGDDPGRAQQALDIERQGLNRSTLISKLESIASKEATMSETTTTEPEAEDVAPVQPVEVLINPADSGTVVSPVYARDADVEVPDDASLAADPDDEDPEPVEADAVEYFQTVAATNGLVLAINGTAYGFSAQQTATLKSAVNQAVAGLTL